MEIPQEGNLGTKRQKKRQPARVKQVVTRQSKPISPAMQTLESLGVPASFLIPQQTMPEASNQVCVVIYN